MSMQFPDDDKAMTEIFRKHMGRCPIVDVSPSSFSSEVSTDRNRKKEHAIKLRQYGVPVALCAEVLDCAESTISAATRGVIGEPPKRDGGRAQRVLERRQAGELPKNIAADEGISATRVYAILKRAKS